jgi:hypothetical protein
MVTEMEKRIEEKRNKRAQELLSNIKGCSDLTSKGIMDKYLPKTKDSIWYIQNCIGEDKIPDRAVNGHIKGTPFYTKDKKIMNSRKANGHDRRAKPERRTGNRDSAGWG